MADNQKERRRKESKLVDEVFPGGIIGGKFYCYSHGGQVHIYTKTFWTMYKDHVGTFDSNKDPQRPIFTCYSESYRSLVESFASKYKQEFGVEVKIE